jgi:HSP20 family protein
MKNISNYSFDDLFKTFEDIFLEDDWFRSFPINFAAECASTVATSIPVDIYLKENRDYVLEAALAGYNKEDISIKFEGNYLTLSGKKKEIPNGDKRKYLHRGLKKSAFSTKLLVPKAKYEQNKTTAQMINGVLVIVIPSREVTKETNESIKVNIS